MATLGQQLRQSREEKGVTLRDIANATHIGVRFLQAIESDTYDILPGGVFNRAFVRKYARHIGFDEEQAIKLYEEQLEEQGGEPTRRYQYGVEDFEVRPSSGNGLLLSFVALLILAALAYAAYQYFAPVVSDQNTSRPGSASTPGPTPAVSATPAPAVSPNASSSPSTNLLSGSASAGGMRVQLIATGEECWLSIKPDAGKQEQVILGPGDVREFNVNDRIVLFIGRLTSLRITINGRIVNYSKLLPGQKGVVANNVVITRDNYQQYLD